MIKFIGLICVLAALCHLAHCKRGKRVNTWSQDSGDIAQLKFRRTDVSHNALKRDATNKWDYIAEGDTFVVPYTIKGDYDDEELEIIQGAMTAIEKNTCIRFRVRTTEADFMELENRPFEGCYTIVGRMSGSNVVQLEANNMATCIEHDIVMHELLHSLGIWHEQMRYDRDQYIKILYDNIPPAMQGQFDVVSDAKSTTYDEPYDYTSVMHYPKDAFSKGGGKITMQTMDPKYQDIIGNSETASPSDYRKICTIYGCAQCMGKPFEDPAAQPMTTTTAAPSPNVACTRRDSFLCGMFATAKSCAKKGSYAQRKCCHACAKKRS